MYMLYVSSVVFSLDRATRPNFFFFFFSPFYAIIHIIVIIYNNNRHQRFADQFCNYVLLFFFGDKRIKNSTAREKPANFGQNFLKISRLDFAKYIRVIRKKRI